uniref:Uncharacterized protein n=1 Tax=Setaria viridis TaxID=4556 RepID=A0A4U6VHS8_SETVI|nr:hypothetical protein SEVIR_3G378301v2 [Setaria viridis]
MRRHLHFPIGGTLVPVGAPPEPIRFTNLPARSVRPFLVSRQSRAGAPPPTSYPFPIARSAAPRGFTQEQLSAFWLPELRRLQWKTPVIVVGVQTGPEGRAAS